MSISSQWDEHRRIWIFDVGESFELSDVFDLANETDWSDAKSFLWDLRSLKKGPSSSSEVLQAVDLTAKNLETFVGSRVAILVARDLDFGIARMFSALADETNVEYRVFRDEPTAFEWLAASSHP